jgi:hypothetical protein
MYQVSGKIYLIKSEQKVSEKFRKREFVIIVEGNYPQYLSFQATQDNCSLLDKFKQGDIIKISFNLRGREWKSPSGEVKYFNTLEAWRIENEGASSQSQNEPVYQDYSQTDSPTDDLPF